eukprot:403344941
MKTNTEGLLNYSQSSQTGLSQGTSRFDFRQIMSPIPADSIELDQYWLKQVHQQEIDNQPTMQIEEFKNNLQSQNLINKSNSNTTSTNHHVKTTDFQTLASQLNNSCLNSNQPQKFMQQRESRETHNTRYAFDDSKQNESMGFTLLESKYLKEQPPSQAQTPQNEFEKTSSTVIIHDKHEFNINAQEQPFQDAQKPPRVYDQLNIQKDLPLQQMNKQNLGDNIYGLSKNANPYDNYEKQRHFSFSEQKRRQSCDDDQVNMFIQKPQDNQIIIQNYEAHQTPINLMHTQYSKRLDKRLYRHQSQDPQLFQSQGSSNTLIFNNNNQQQQPYSTYDRRDSTSQHFHNDSITEKIKELRQDIQVLFPQTNNEVLEKDQSLSPSRHLNTQLACSQVFDDQNYMACTQQSNQPQSVERCSKIQVYNQTARNLQSSFLNAHNKILPTLDVNPNQDRSKSRERLQSSQLQKSMIRLTSRIEENMQQNNNITQRHRSRSKERSLNKTTPTSRNNLEQPLQIQHLINDFQTTMQPNQANYHSDHFTISPIPQIISTMSMNECDMYKQKIAQLQSQLQKEKSKIKEFKERMTRRKEAEQKKYQSEIEQLKLDLKNIEVKYTEEVKRLEDKYTKYRQNKNLKFQSQLKDLSEKYEQQLKMERQLSKQLELELRDFKIQNGSFDQSNLLKKIERMKKKFETQKLEELEKMKLHYEQKLNEQRVNYQSIINNIKQQQSLEFEEQLNILRYKNAKLDQENEQLKEFIAVKDLKKPQGILKNHINCSNCESLKSLCDNLENKIQQYSLDLPQKPITNNARRKSVDFNESQELSRDLDAQLQDYNKASNQKPCKERHSDMFIHSDHAYQKLNFRTFQSRKDSTDRRQPSITRNQNYSAMDQDIQAAHKYNQRNKTIERNRTERIRKQASQEELIYKYQSNRQ